MATINNNAQPVKNTNRMRILLALLFTNLSDALISTKTLLPWLFITQGVPPLLLSFLVPIRESLALIPQSFIARLLIHVQTRKYIWVVGALLQAVFIFAMLQASIYSQGLALGIWVLVLLAGFSFARAFCSLTIKELMGKCLAKSVRGRTSGLATSLSALLVIGFSGYALTDSHFLQQYSHYLFLLAAACWLLAICFVVKLLEVRQAQTPSLAQKSSVSLFFQNRLLRHFIISRGCLLMSGLLAPYVLMLAQQHTQNGQLLAQFIFAASAAQVISPTFWGYFADFSSKQVMQLAAVIAALVAVGCLLLQVFWSASALSAWLFAGLFFMLNIAHAGVRIGRATYVVNMSEQASIRTLYIATSNSLIGWLLLICGLLVGAFSMLGITWVLTFFLLLAIFALLSLSQLPEVEPA